jgi:hypothetical protein
MKPTIQPKTASLGFKIGFILAVTYFFLIAFSIIYMLWKPGEPWHMFWVLLDYLDFPVSLLLTHVILWIYSAGFSISAPYLIGGPLMFITFCAFHLVVGTIWYFYLPILLEKVSRTIAINVTGRITVILLMITPILSYWLQLAKFLPHNVPRFTPWTNSWLPVLWVALFIWLYSANSQRKRALWLLCLTPFVFSYLAYDLYYCIKFGL